MRLRSNTAAVARVLLIIGAAGFVSAGGGAPTGPIEETEARAKVCAEAKERFAELYGDAKKDDVVLVTLYKYNFCPLNITVKSGTTVRWINIDKRTSHSVWLKQAGEPESERFFPEEQWDFTFMTPGKYPYLCGPHWEKEGMVGFVEVTP